MNRRMMVRCVNTECGVMVRCMECESDDVVYAQLG